MSTSEHILSSSTPSNLREHFYCFASLLTNPVTCMCKPPGEQTGCLDLYSFAQLELRSSDAQVDLESVELAPVSMADLRGGQVPAPLGTMDCAAGQASARQPGGSRAPQRRSAPSAPSLNEWSALRRETPDETPRAHQGARTGSRSAPPPRQHRTAQPRQRMSFEQRVSCFLQGPMRLVSGFQMR